MISSIIRFWNAKPTQNWVEHMDWKEGQMFTLRLPNPEGYEPSISFCKFTDHPEHTRVRSRNWKCEYEPSGIFSTEDCRKLYRNLIANGFKIETEE